MDIFKDFIHLAELALLLYFGVVSVYLLLFAFLGSFYKLPIHKKSTKKSQLAIIIFDVGTKNRLVQAIESSVNQEYPLGKFEVIIISNTYLKANEKIASFPIRIIQYERKLKKRSELLKSVITSIEKKYDLAIIINSRNTLRSNFLCNINTAYQNGNQIIQGHRLRKGIKTPQDKYNFLTEEMNNHIFRKGHNTLGLSASLLGWGIACEFNLLKEILLHTKRLKYNNFDKMLENELVQRNKKITYLEDTCFYEKISQHSFEFKQQRIKWLYNNQLYFKSIMSQLRKIRIKHLNINLINKTFQLMILPKALFFSCIVMGTLLDIIYCWLYPFNQNKSLFWMLILMVNIITIVLAIPHKFYRVKYLNAFRILPKIISLMYYACFKTKKIKR